MLGCVIRPELVPIRGSQLMFTPIMQSHGINN